MMSCKNDKMSEKQKNKLDSHCVSQRVLQTKKEIEQLKLELQKLINRGIHTEATNVNVISISENKDDKLQNIKNDNCVPSYSTCHKNVSIRKSPVSTALPKNYSQAIHKNKESSPKRFRHYNVEDAREYIKKQKEKRQEKMKMQIKESKNEINIRKEKLKELQKRSLELVQKNINFKRERSSSRERGILQTKTTVHNDIGKNILPIKKTQLENIALPTCSEQDGFRVPDLNVKMVPATCSNEDENVQMNIDFKTVCVRNDLESRLVNFQDLLNTYSEEHHKAAIKIQSFYRGYCQRKCYKQLVKMKKKVSYLAKNIKSITSTESQNKMEKVSGEPPKEDVPFWLQTCVQPHPYNFISAVKRKLNLAVNTPFKTSSDVGIQISLNEPQKENLEKVRDKIKKSLIESTKSRHSDVATQRSHKCLNLNVGRAEELHLQNDEFVHINSDCDSKKHSNNLFLRKTHSKIEHIDALENETSESDTSKNIPDISSESTVHSKSNAKSVSEYKLEINVEKLKDLKLKNKFNVMENTMDILSDDIHKQEKISLEEVPQIVEYVENSSSMKTSENIETDLGSDSLQKSSFTHKENKHLKTNTNTKTNSVYITSFEKEIRSAEKNPEPSDVKDFQHNSLSRKSIYSEINPSNLKDANTIGSPMKVDTESNILNTLNEKTRKLHNEVEFDENLKSFLEYMTSLEESKKSRKTSLQKSSSTKTSNSFKSLLSKSQKSSVSVDSSSKIGKENLIEESYSSNFSNSTSSITSSVPLLKRPSVTLTTSENIGLPIQEENKSTLCIKPGEVKCIETKINTNQIHLKFEAELHLLNDFNESLRQFMAVEKSLLELQSKSQQNITVYQNQDTQTTDPLQKDLHDKVHSETVKSQTSQRIIPSINYSRGSEVAEELNFENSDFIANDERSVATGFELSQLNESSNSSIAISVLNTTLPDIQDVSFTKNVYAGFSVGMFDQLIKDEDARIENLKTILKIREKALLDRTKGELAWLEIQKKHLIETGQLHEASLLKKKQRGIIIKLQHEKQEMQRLKQIQKAASKERKTILKEQRNMIKAQLSNNTTLPKIRRSLQKGKRNLGPVKVYNLHRETINTETSISRRSSVAEEIVITSRSDSIIGQISEEIPHDQDNSIILNTSFKSILSKKTETEAKKTLLMREAALQKRRKAAEDLLQWHQRLLEEERKIAELELAANTIIKQVPIRTGDSICKTEEEQYDFKGSQLNILWTNMTGKKERKFADEQIYTYSQTALEKFCKEAINNCDQIKNDKELKQRSTITNNNIQDTEDKYSNINESDLDDKPNNYQSSDISDKSSNESIKTDTGRSHSSTRKSVENSDNSNSYTSEFNSPEVIEECTSKGDEYIPSDIFKSSSSVHTEVLVNEIDKSKSTLNEIMQNISNITDEISAIYKLSSVTNTIKDESVLPVVKTNQNNTSASIKNTCSTIKESLNNENGFHEDISEDDTLKTSLQSEIVKSLTELISSQNACQDIKSKQKHSIIETPESVCSKNILTDSQVTLESNSEIYSNSNNVAYEVNKLKSNKENEILLSNHLNKELSVQEVIENSLNEDTHHITKDEDVLVNNIELCGSIEDLRKQSNQSVDSDMCSNIAENIFSVNESQNQCSENISNSESPSALDLSYGFTGIRTKKSESTLLTSDNKNETVEDLANVPDEIHTGNGFYGKEVQIDTSNSYFKEEEQINTHVTDKETCENLTKSKVEIKTTLEDKTNSSISEKINLAGNIHDHSVSNDSNKSVEETTISTGSDFGKSMSANEINISHKNQEIIEFQLVTENKSFDESKFSSLKETIGFIDSNKNISNEYIDVIEDSLITAKTILGKSNLLDKDVSNKKSSKDFDHSSSDIKDSLKTGISELITNNNNNNNTLNTISDRDTTITDFCNKSDIIKNILNDEFNTKTHDEEFVLELDTNTCKEKENRESVELNDISDISTKDENVVDVKKRVSEILADTNTLREDKSPRLQDIYTTTYDVLSPENSPEIGSPVANEKNVVSVTQMFDEEAEALFKKQLAIEQEIKQLEQQQKEHIPYIYMREIPNKPPPPYTPPATAPIHAANVLPSSPEQLQSVVSNIAGKLFKAYENGNIENATVTINEDVKLLNKINVGKECYEFMFDLCKEFAIDHYKQFVEQTGPSWIFVNKKPLTKQKPFNKDDLKKFLLRKVKEVLGLEKVIFKENMITKWSRKKRDHVDELLVIESQTEESEWTNYDDDEIIVKNELTNDIMNMLLTETANVISKIFTKKMSLS